MLDVDTELTTRGNGKYRCLVEALYGSVTWGEVKLSTKDEFLDAYGSGNHAVWVKLAVWIVYHGLENRFKQAEQQQK